MQLIPYVEMKYYLWHIKFANETSENIYCMLIVTSQGCTSIGHKKTDLVLYISTNM